MLFWSTMSDSFNPHCRLCLRLRHHVWASVSCWLIWNSTFMFVLTCVCVGACVSFFSQNLPCGRSRPWASVRRVCARLSQPCHLKLCRLKLSSFLRSVCPTLSPFSSPFHPFLRAALPFFSNSHCKGLFEASSIPLRSFQIIASIIPSYPWCAPWPQSSLSLPASEKDQRLKNEGPSSLKVWKRDDGLDYLLWLRLTVPVVYRQCERTLFKEETWEVRAFREWQQWIWMLLDGGGEMGSEQNRDLVRSWQMLFLSFQSRSSQRAHPEAPPHPIQSRHCRIESWMDRLSLTSQP